MSGKATITPLPNLTGRGKSAHRSVGTAILAVQHIKGHRKAVYTSLQLSGKMKSYLADIDQQTQVRLNTTIQQMAHKVSLKN